MKWTWGHQPPTRDAVVSFIWVTFPEPLPPMAHCPRLPRQSPKRWPPRHHRAPRMDEWMSQGKVSHPKRRKNIEVTDSTCVFQKLPKDVNTTLPFWIVKLNGINFKPSHYQFCRQFMIFLKRALRLQPLHWIWVRLRAFFHLPRHQGAELHSKLLQETHTFQAAHCEQNAQEEKSIWHLMRQRRIRVIQSYIMSFT